MHGEHTAHHILVDLQAEGTGDVLRDARTTEAGIAALHFDEDGDACRRGTVGTGFGPRRG
jgi:hypothetical protein